ncbi:MAG: NAD-dependent epimerase/dehydratase family protein [Arenicellales bacterium]|nr:NAD-dependent epimerase/dehydratase family protein [Arenicellales bacterium]
MAILVTGAAGFIGATLSKTLLDRGDAVVGLDSLNDYYDVALKRARLERLEALPTFTFERGDIAVRDVLPELFNKHQIHAVIHLAAQAGVRYSMENPAAYIDANLVGFGNILEAVRQADGIPLVYASSSSVYGANDKLPFSERDRVDQPMSLYAATKRSNELMAYSYAHLYRLPLVGLRFFTVYGPWGRPDMALFKFTKAILNDEPITLYNRGNMVRDFTYIDDAVRAVIGILDACLGQTLFDETSTTPWRVYNIGNHKKVPLMDYVRVLEQCLGRKAAVDLLPMQDGDVPETDADVSKLVGDFGASISIDIEEGIARFVAWYREYYKV